MTRTISEVYEFGGNYHDNARELAHIREERARERRNATYMRRRTQERFYNFSFDKVDDADRIDTLKYLNKVKKIPFREIIGKCLDSHKLTKEEATELHVWEIENHG